jgi:hypothetical protein
MIKKVVVKRKLHDRRNASDDLKYWLSRTPTERIEADD